jgi:hypothetical protein
LFVPAAGSTRLQPVELWIPRDGMSCQAAFGIFDGATAGRS